MTIAVFGATGQLGTRVIHSLLSRGVAAEEIRAIGRDATRLAALADQGVQAQRADLRRPDEVDAAVKGAESILLISASDAGQRVAQHRSVIDAASAAGVSLFAYTSAPNAQHSALVLAPDHKATEDLIAASGLPAAILRNSWYTENYRGTFEQARETGRLESSVGGGRVASATRQDYADAAAAVLTTPGHEGTVYELSGDVAWSFEDFTAAASRVLGADVELVAITREQQHRSLLAHGLDEATANFLVALDDNTRDGLLGGTSGDLARLIARPTTPMETTMQAWV